MLFELTICLIYFLMNQYQLVVHQFILKQGCEQQLVEDFYDYQAMFLFLPSFYTDQMKTIVLPKFNEPQTWLDASVTVAAGDTRQLLNMTYKLEIPEHEQLHLRFNLVQQLKESYDQWGALQEHLNDHDEVTKKNTHLHSLRLTEVALPATLLQQPTTITLNNQWVDIKFEIRQ